MFYDKLFTGDSRSALDEIVSSYKDKGYSIVNYLYFANIISGDLFGENKDNIYRTSLLLSNFLLPDGIALQTFFKIKFGRSYHNLNGTDFSDFVLRNLPKDSFNLILYGARPEVIGKAASYVEDKYGIKVYCFQDGYKDFDFSSLDGIGNDKINIMMIGKGTPLQEIRTYNNIENIKKYGLLIMNQGGTFDFWGGVDKRAPNIIIKLKAEWIWRLLTNPKKNFKKVWNSLYLVKMLLKKYQ